MHRIVAKRSVRVIFLEVTKSSMKGRTYVECLSVDTMLPFPMLMFTHVREKSYVISQVEAKDKKL